MAVPVGKPGDLQPPPGAGAQLAIGGYWPSISETDIQDIADEHSAAAKSFSDYAETLQMQLARSSELLDGQGGTARIAHLTKMRDHAVESADHTQSKVVTAEDYMRTVVGFKQELITIGDDAQEDWERARSSKRMFDPSLYQKEAATAYSNALNNVAKAPPPLPMPGEDAENANTGEQPSAGKDELKPGEALPGERQVDPDGTEAEATFASDRKGDELGPFEALPNEEPGTAPLGNSADSERPVAEIAGATNDQSGLPLAGAPMGGAGRPSGGGSPAGSLGSQLGSVKPPQVPSSAASSLGGKSLADAATAPASSVSDALGGSRSPLSSAASNFQTGLTSGMGSSGAVSAPLEKFTGTTQHPVASLSAPGPQAPVVPAQGGPPASAGAGLGPVMGGGGAMAPMVPPAGTGGGALPPYVPPGAGTGAAVPPAGAAPTAAASGSSSPGSVQQGGGAAAGGAPVVAGSGAAAAAGLPGDEVNPDLLLAQRVLDGLVRGTTATSETFNGGWIRWAVSVLRTPAGDTRTVIASSVGGGLYLPEGVAFPVTAQIATLDPALPWGWGQLFMGWNKPTSVLAAHADEVCNSVAGLRRSALATTEDNAERPAGWDDFATVSAAAPGAAPSLGGEYQHRLASISAELNSRINEFDSKLHLDAGALITEAVSASAKQLTAELPVGMAPLIDTYDFEHVLGPLSRGEQVDWEAHYQHLAARAEGAVLHPIMAGGLLDLDESEISNHSRVVYMHHYRAGLLAEMLRCWRSDPPSLHDIVYCAVAAGFPPAGVIEALKRAASQGARTP